MRRWAWALAALGAGCSQQVVEVALPDVPGTRSILVAMRYDDRLTVYAVDREAEPSSWALPGLPEVHGDVRLAALLYPETLAELGREAGELLVDPAGEPPPSPRRGRFQLTVEGGAPSGWAEVGALDADLDFQLVPLPRGHCRTPRFVARDLGTPGRVLAAFPLPEGGVLAINRFGLAFRIHEDVVEPLGSVGLEHVTAGTRTATGTYWLAGYDPLVSAGDGPGHFRPVTQPAIHDAVRWMAAPTRADAPAEVFALTRYGALLRWFEGGWQSQDLTLSAGSDHFGALEWLGPGRVAALSPLQSIVSMVEVNGERSDVVLDVVDATVDLALMDDQLYGLTVSGLLVRLESNTYSTLAQLQVPEATKADTLTPFQGGLLATARGPWITHYQFDKLPCPGVKVPDLEHEVWTAVVSGDVAYLFTGQAAMADEASSWVVTVRLGE